MKTEQHTQIRGSIVPATLAASLFIGVIALLGVTTISSDPIVNMNISPSRVTVTPDDIFPVSISVKSTVPTNVFSGEIHFNHEVLQIESIGYNTSIANLWAEKPWYDNGAGTMNFAGGTTQRGGFTGKGELVTILFKTIQNGEGIISLEKQRVLLHDGLGTDAVVSDTIDTIVNIQQTNPDVLKNLLTQSIPKTDYKVTEEKPTTDLNGDGKQSIADISIFMINISGSQATYDFNQDGKVNLKDLNILMGAE